MTDAGLAPAAAHDARVAIRTVAARTSDKCVLEVCGASVWRLCRLLHWAARSNAKEAAKAESGLLPKVRDQLTESQAQRMCEVLQARFGLTKVELKTLVDLFKGMVCEKGSALCLYLRTHARGLTRPCCAGFGLRYSISSYLVCYWTLLDPRVHTLRCEYY